MVSGCEHRTDCKYDIKNPRTSCLFIYLTQTRKYTAVCKNTRGRGVSQRSHFSFSGFFWKKSLSDATSRHTPDNVRQDFGALLVLAPFAVRPGVVLALEWRRRHEPRRQPHTRAAARATTESTASRAATTAGANCSPNRLNLLWNRPRSKVGGLTVIMERMTWPGRSRGRSLCRWFATIDWS